MTYACPRVHLARAERDRGGFALVAALLAILLMTSLVAAVFFVVSEETKLGPAAREREVGLSAAESGIARAVERLRDAAQDIPDVGHTIALSDVDPTGTVVYITRLDSTLLAVVAEARSDVAHGSGSSRVGLVVSRSMGAVDSIRIDRITAYGWSQLF